MAGLHIYLTIEHGIFRASVLLPMNSHTPFIFRELFKSFHSYAIYLCASLFSGLIYYGIICDTLTLPISLTLGASLILSVYDFKSHQFPVFLWLFFTIILAIFYPVPVTFWAWFILAILAEIFPLKIGAGDFLYLALVSFSMSFIQSVWLIQFASLFGIMGFIFGKEKEIAFVPYLTTGYLMTLLLVQNHLL
ncbi:hypothetical protein [Lactococcus sp.]|uniref:hypothetical protein n=1 Tax=Lactococcus sp. TaxID=44273 RepID=UPI0035ADC8C9